MLPGTKTQDKGGKDEREGKKEDSWAQTQIDRGKDNGRGHILALRKLRIIRSFLGFGSEYIKVSHEVHMLDCTLT